MTPTQERLARARVAYTNAAHNLQLTTQAELGCLHWLQVAEVTNGPTSKAARIWADAWRLAVDTRKTAGAELEQKAVELDSAQTALVAEARS